MIRLSLLALLLVPVAACKLKEPKNVELGGECYRDVQCKSGICVSGACRSGEAGARCAWDDDCKNLDCIQKACAEPGSVGDTCNEDADCRKGNVCTEKKLCESAEKLAAKEAELLEQSGVEESPALEKAAHPPGPGRRVRVAAASAKDEAFAACRADERLVGGGCRVTPKFNDVSMFEASYPSDFGPDDTVGARWRCKVPGREMTAYALCERLEKKE